MNLRNLERRIAKLEAGWRDIPPEVLDAVEEVQASPEVREIKDRYGDVLDRLSERVAGGELEALSPREDEGLDAYWQSVHAAARRIGRARGINPEDLIRALTGR